MNNYKSIKKRGFDVAIFVATPGERDSILKYTKIINKAKWGKEHDNNGDVIRTLLLKNKDGKVLRLALKTLPDMGAEHCVYYASRFLSDHPCTIVSMVGICAGEKKDTQKGDIIIPGKVASITNGKETQGKDKSRTFRPANRVHEMPEEVRKEIDSFKQCHWDSVLKEIRQMWDPSKITKKDDAFFCTPTLHFEKKIMMAQVAHVRAYTGAYSDLKEYASREVVALEMESAALAFVTGLISTNSRWIVAKGVQDHADGKKDHKPRAFCSWASFYTLIKILELQSFGCWEQKVRIKEDIERIRADKTADDLKVAYRSGRFYEAGEIGSEIFNANPDNSAIWRLYLLSLLRLNEYEKAADVICIADYYIQNRDIKEEDAIDYLVAKSDYYRRIGSFKDSDAIVEEIIIRCADTEILKERKAEAYYMKGRILMQRHQSCDRDSLEEAKGKFSAATKLSPKKYWAGIMLMFTQHLESRKNVLNQKEVKRIEIVLNEHIKENKYRPAPRIYKLKLRALQVAAGEMNFKNFKKEINEDAKECLKKLLLPDDFFSSFDSDCRLLFSDNNGRYKQDMLLSLIYHWASKVRA